MPRVTPLFGFKPPFVKGGEIVLPVLVGSGEWAELSATAVTWKRIWRALRSATEPEVDAAPKAEPSRKIGYIVAPAGDDAPRAVPPSHANPSLRQPLFRPHGGL